MFEAEKLFSRREKSEIEAEILIYHRTAKLFIISNLIIQQLLIAFAASNFVINRHRNASTADSPLLIERRLSVPLRTALMELVNHHLN